MVRRFVIVTAVVLAGVVPASAAPILQINAGILTGATGVDVGGTFYDVAFVDSTCVAAFNNCDEVTDFAFQTQQAADAASAAILAQVFLDGPLGNFDSSPVLTLGCTNTLGCFIQTPYGLPGPSLLVAQSALNGPSVAGDAFSINIAFSRTFDLSTLSSDVYARWTPATATPVPEPASMTLLGLGLAGLGARRWRQRRNG